MTRTPDFDELVGAEVTPEEVERLRRVHDLLVRVGPPPELPASLAETPARPGPEVRLLPRRRLGASLVLAAAFLVAAFGAGYFAGDRAVDEAAFETDRTVFMRGTAAAPNAAASLVLGRRDESGNWPMRMIVQGLPALREDAWYELVLTRDGRPATPCGTFKVDGRTMVFLNAPFRLREFDGWAVVRQGSEELLVRTEKV